jgi:uncharacterized lipoprotein YmbA
MRRSLLTSLLLLAGCLGPRQDPSAYFLLSPGPAPATVTPVPVVLGLGPVTIPGYLDRPQIVVRLSENEVALSETDRWAEPLAQHLIRTLEENLSRMLPGSSYVDYPWYESEAPDYALTLDIRRFEADAAGGVVLDATWLIQDRTTRVDGGTSRIDEVVGGLGRADAVAAQSRALARLSEEIAAAVRRAGRRP